MVIVGTYLSETVKKTIRPDTVGELNKKGKKKSICELGLRK